MLFTELVLASLAYGSSSPAPLPSSLEATRGITYVTRDRIELRLDVVKSRYLNPGQMVGAVLFLHGGAWRDGRRDGPNPVQNELAARGYICVQASYRFSQEGHFPAQLHDARAALRWIAENADAWSIDRQRIGIWGMSAGGHLALLAAYSKDAMAEAGAPVIPVRAVAAVMPTTDILGVYQYRLTQRNVRANLIGPASPETQLLGANPPDRPDLARAASPTSYAGAGCPPTLLIHGIRDETVPVQQSRSLHALLQQSGVRSQLLTPAALGHEARWELFQDGVVDFFARELAPTR